MSFDRDERYPHVADLQRDIEAYQNGRATRAENASLGKQLVLLVKRHKALFSTAAAAWLIITALAVWFIISIRTSERKATHNAAIAERNAQIAAANEQKATQNATLAATNEQKAVAEKENTRRALAKSQLALAEAAFREGDGLAMQAALNEVPDDLRDTNWNYLLARSDTSIGLLRVRGSSGLSSVVAHPTQPGVFALGRSGSLVALVNVATTERKRLWDSASMAFPDKDHAGAPRLAFSPDGTRIAVGRYAGLTGVACGIVILDASNGSKLFEWKAPRSFSLEFSPDGKALLQSRGVMTASTFGIRPRASCFGRTSRKGMCGRRFTRLGSGSRHFRTADRLRLLNPQNGAVHRKTWPSSLIPPWAAACSLSGRQPGRQVGSLAATRITNLPRVEYRRSEQRPLCWEAVAAAGGFRGTGLHAQTASRSSH